MEKVYESAFRTVCLPVGSRRFFKRIFAENLTFFFRFFDEYAKRRTFEKKTVLSVLFFFKDHFMDLSKMRCTEKSHRVDTCDQTCKIRNSEHKILNARQSQPPRCAADATLEKQNEEETE